MSPTQRTLRLLEKQGHRAAIAEYWNAFAGRRVDLFGFIDVVALRPGAIVGIQVTDGGKVGGGHLSHRKKKILGPCREDAIAWLKGKGEIEIWAWRQVKPRGETKPRWEPRIERITLADF